MQTFTEYNGIIMKSCSIKNQLAILLELKPWVRAPCRCNGGRSSPMLCSESNLLSRLFMLFRRIGLHLTVLPGLKPIPLNVFSCTGGVSYIPLDVSSSTAHFIRSSSLKSHPSSICRAVFFGHLLQNAEDNQKEQHLISVNAYKHSQCGESTLY